MHDGFVLRDFLVGDAFQVLPYFLYAMCNFLVPKLRLGNTLARKIQLPPCHPVQKLPMNR